MRQFISTPRHDRLLILTVYDGINPNDDTCADLAVYALEPDAMAGGCEAMPPVKLYFSTLGGLVESLVAHGHQRTDNIVRLATQGVHA